MVEKAIQDTPIRMKLPLVVELKSENRRIEAALNQIYDSIPEIVDQIGHHYGSPSEVFAIVQSGIHTGFSEYHNDRSDLDEEDIPHFRGFTSLTQNYSIKVIPQVVTTNIRSDLERKIRPRDLK